MLKALPVLYTQPSESCSQEGLSGAVISLLNANGNAIESYDAGDTTDLGIYYFRAAYSQQKWIFNVDGSIANAAFPNLLISSNKDKDASMSSIYFSLQNPRTGLAIGVEGSCTNNALLVMQDVVYGSPNQQFLYLKDEKRIVSFMCREYALSIPVDDCSTTTELRLSQMDLSSDRSKWVIDDNGTIRSIGCENKYITINGAEGGRAVKVASLSKTERFLQNSMSGSPENDGNEKSDNDKQNSMRGSPKKNANKTSDEATYTDASRDQKTTWDKQASPGAGSNLVISALNIGRFQKWEMEHQVSHCAMYSFLTPPYHS